MNDLRKAVEYRIYEAGSLERINLYELNEELNRTILGAINRKHPIQVLREKLKAMG
jgi:predicted nucleotidyltransferase